MLGYCRVVHATAHIMSQITVKHLGNYKLSPVNKLVDTRMRRNVNGNGFNGGWRGVGNVNIPHSNQGPHLTRACAETLIGTDLTPEKRKRYSVTVHRLIYDVINQCRILECSLIQFMCRSHRSCGSMITLLYISR